MIEETISLVFKDALSLSFLINLAQIEGGVTLALFFTTFCSGMTTDDDVTVEDEAVVRGTVASVAVDKHVFDEVVVITDENVVTVVDAEDCGVAFPVVGLDVKLRRRI